MVVCKCRKATKLYCFVHKVPVCGECICFPEHQICVVNAYAQWVIDGDYDWPPKCCLCQAVLAEGTDPQTTRLGCLHVTHTSCLVSHIKSFPLHTAPAGYVCPACPTSIWPPKNFKDSGSHFHAKLKEAILQTGLEKSLFGNYPVPQSEIESQSPPPAFATGPLVHSSTNIETFGNDAASTVRPNNSEIVEVNGPSAAPFSNSHDANFIKSPSPGPGATTRKSAMQIEKPNSEISYYADDEDGNRKKYSRRGSFRNKFLRALLPFWPNPPPILPVTSTPRKDADDTSEGRARHHRPKRMDPRKLLLVLAIMACLATMGILYYRIAQRGLNEELIDDGRE